MATPGMSGKGASMKTAARLVATLSAGALLLLGAQNTAPEEEIWRHRNLGKAFFENPTTPKEAVREFKAALDLKPDSVREQLNYALALLRTDRTEEAIKRLAAVQKQAPQIPHTWFNLGVHYKKLGEVGQAITQFEGMVRLAPDEPKSRYNLGALYRQTGRLQDARRELELAATLDPNLAAPHFQLYGLYRQMGRREDALREVKEFERLKKAQEGAAIGEDVEWSDYAEIWDPIDVDGAPAPPAPQFEVRTLANGLDGDSAAMLALDSEGAGRADLLVWSRDGISLFRGGVSPAGDTGLGGVKDVVSVAAGDADNDGLPDLCVLTGTAPALYRNLRGRFAAAQVELAPGRFEKALWLDYDHDYDLDLVLLGLHSRLLRNQGSSGFADRTADFPFLSGRAIDAVLTRVISDSRAFDLVVSYADRAGALHLDKLGGRFEALSLPELPAGSRGLRAEDFNRDAWLDLVYDKGRLVNSRGRFEPAAVVPHAAERESVRADFDADGREDEARLTVDGRLHLALNRTPQASTWLGVRLVGVRNIKLACAAEVEVKSGRLYQKRIYAGIPLAFELGGRAQADTVRITWPNGLIQNEIGPSAGHAYEYKEAQRLSGSCPMIWTWNGSGFEFVTDVLGVAPLGASSGDGKFFPVDHDEYIQIPAGALKAEGSRYELRVTEELSEVSYLDQLRLIAVDQPAGIEVFTNDKWKSPPFPEFRLFGARRRVYPRSARDGQGRDVLNLLLERDHAYPGSFRRSPNGVAETHYLTLDFGPAAPDGRAVLILNGWVDWADGSAFAGAAQERGEGLVPPLLQARDDRGRWRTIVPDMGMPSGKPKTIAVNLSGRFPGKSRELRVETNLCVYWDEIFLSEDSSPPPVVLTDVPLAAADLHFRGFSRPVIDPERKQPESFEYSPVRPTSAWNPTPGMYTRYGDVRELLTTVDDRYVIMGSGDEIRLTFDGRKLLPLKPGWERSFLLKADGWAKDRDANTAFSQTVEPLPFHGMVAYPYPTAQHYPADARHDTYRRKYNTRPALLLLRPLAVESVQHRDARGPGNIF